MKGYIPIEIPTKKYIKAYITSQLGDKPIMTIENVFGNKLYDLLQHKTNERVHNTYRYNDSMKLYINYWSWQRRGGFLNQTNLRQFNLFIEADIKRQFRLYMDFYISTFPSFEANLPAVRAKLGIDIESWSDDSMRKDYYRYRIASGKPLLYGKMKSRSVLPEKPENVVF